MVKNYRYTTLIYQMIYKSYVEHTDMSTHLLKVVPAPATHLALVLFGMFVVSILWLHLVVRQESGAICAANMWAQSMPSHAHFSIYVLTHR